MSHYKLSFDTQFSSKIGPKMDYKITNFALFAELQKILRKIFKCL